MIGMWWLGELVAGDYILPYDEYYAPTPAASSRQFNFEDELPGMQALRDVRTARSTSFPTTRTVRCSTTAATSSQDPAHMDAFRRRDG